MTHKKENEAAFFSQDGFVFIGEFSNEHGEDYALYIMRGLPGLIFVTGDELNWEAGWQISPYSQEVTQVFALTPLEKQGAATIIKAYKEGGNDNG